MMPKSFHPRVRFAGLAGAALVAGMTLLSYPGAVLADDGLPAPGGWAARMGVGVQVGPSYGGGEGAEASPLPLIDLVYRTDLPGLDTVFLNTGDGLGFVVLRRGPLSIGGSIGYAGGRDQDDDDRLRGLGDIDGAARGRVFLRTDFGRAGASVEVDRAFGEQEGTTVALAAFVRQPVTASFSLTARAGVVWADDDHMAEWFGVNAAQASRTAYPVYEAEAGFREATLSLTGSYAVTPRWAVRATIGVSRLLGDAADSPIVERETTPFGGIGVSYRF